MPTLVRSSPSPPRGPRDRRRARLLRRLLAAGLVAGAGGVAVSVLAPPSTPTRSVLVAATDLPAGARPGPGEVETRSWPVDLVPDGALASVEGVVLSGPLRRGEVLTDARRTGSGLLSGRAAGTLAVVVPLDATAAATGITAGSRVDVLVPTEDPVTGAADGARRIGRDLVVLAVTSPGDDASGFPGAGAPAVGAVLAVDAATAEELTAAGDRARVALRAS